MKFTVTSFLAHTWEHAVATQGPFRILVGYDRMSCWQYQYRIYHICEDTGLQSEVAYGFDSCGSKADAKDECLTSIDIEMKRLERVYAGE